MLSRPQNLNGPVGKIEAGNHDCNDIPAELRQKRMFLHSIYFVIYLYTSHPIEQARVPDSPTCFSMLMMDLGIEWNSEAVASGR